MGNYNVWMDETIFDSKTVKRVKSMSKEELIDSFSSNLEFGTAGLRGIMDAGTNRMNRYTVKRAAIAVAKWIKSNSKENKRIVIGYDIRYHSREFARITANVMDYFDIEYVLFDTIVATPQLAYAVRFYHAFCGVMVTASHNPREYNGYKVYGQNGSQILENDALIIEKYMSEISFESLGKYQSDKEIVIRDHRELFNQYLKAVSNLSLYNYDKPETKVVYSPYNGCGLYIAKKILEAKNYEYFIPEKQENPDPDFTTIPYPNPELKETFTESIALAKLKGADFIVVNDPDADRINLAIKKGQEYEVLTGNKLGALLSYYIVKRREDLGLTNHGRFVKTIVSDEFAFDIVKDYGYNCSESLTGFKNISKFANKLENSEEAFIMGYEESIGYEISSLVRDKDGLSALLYVLDMAEYFSNQGKMLYQVMEDLNKRYGYHCENNFSIYFKGISGKKQMDDIMRFIREGNVDDNLGFKVTNKIDYLDSKDPDMRTDSIKYEFGDKLSLAIRPSGTEPKMKFYIYGKSFDFKECSTNVKRIEERIRSEIDKITNNGLY